MNAKAPLNIIALENCWENVHPDVVYVAERFAGYPYWMVFTPYPLLNDRVENPTIRASHDGINWEKVPGLSDPVVPPPDTSEMHHADPELVYSSGRLHLIYLTIQKRTRSVIFNAMSCKSDLHWNTPQVIHEDVGAVSPTFQVDGKLWHEWFIQSHSIDGSFVNTRKHSDPSELLHREGFDLASLGNERLCHVEIPKHIPWHVDVLRVDEGYEALIAAFPYGTDVTRTRLFHLASKDGLIFKLSGNSPVIQPSRFGWDNRLIYRSSFLKERNGTYRIWYSAASWGWHFGIGFLQGSLNSLTDPASSCAPVPQYIKRLPGELNGWFRYQLAHHLPLPLLSVALRLHSS
jgi:hypothetical protein